MNAYVHIFEYQPGVHELGLGLEEVLDLLGGVVLRLASDALKLLEIVLHESNLGARHDVLVVHSLILYVFCVCLYKRRMGNHA
jgi:hypothetical protein